MGFLCIDIGGTNTLLGLGNGEFETVRKIPSRKFLLNMEGNVEKLKEETDIEIKRIAVAAAGPINREEGVFYPPNIDIEEINLREPLEKHGEVSIINDCTSAVLGEYFYGGHDCENLVYVTVSSGIGAGVILDGNLVEGSDGNFGEIGHMKVREEGVQCGCGAEGHWEAFCSGNNLPVMAEKVAGSSFKDAKTVFEKYRNESSEAKKVIEKMKRVNADGFANIVNLYNPDKIVVGGAVALNHEDIVVGGLEEEVDVRTVNTCPEIEVCGLGEKSVLHGLRAVCNKEI